MVDGSESPECGRNRVEARREAAAEACLPMTTQAPPRGCRGDARNGAEARLVSGAQPTGRLTARTVWRTIVTQSPLFTSLRQTVLLLQLRGPSLRLAVTAAVLRGDVAAAILRILCFLPAVRPCRGNSSHHVLPSRHTRHDSC